MSSIAKNETSAASRKSLLWCCWHPQAEIFFPFDATSNEEWWLVLRSDVDPVSLVYGVRSYHVAEWVHDIGIRRALGAETPRVLMGIVSRGFRLCLLGVVFGLGGAIATSRIIRSMLFNTFPFIGRARWECSTVS